MSSVEELKNQRDLLLVKIKHTSNKLRDAVSDHSERLVAKRRDELKELLQQFDDLHTRYVTKKKGSFEDPENFTIYELVQKVSSDMEELLDSFDLSIQQNIIVNNKRSLISSFNAGVQRVTAALTELEERENLEPSAAFSQELDFLEKEYYVASEKFKAFFELEDDQEIIASNREVINEAERSVRKLLLNLRIRSGAPGSTGSASCGSRSSSPSRAHVLKTKRMEFPTFSGSIRTYITFKRDFKEIVEQSQDFTEPQMSQILRNECLKEEPKLLVANIYNYNEVWKKLDECYHDEQQVVELVTHELMAVKMTEEEDFEAFIKLVDKVEKAHLDLNAMGNTTVMNHPMTTALILERCPQWVRKEAASRFSKEGIRKENEFNMLLQLLEEKRREARRLQHWGRSEVKKKNNVPSFPPKKNAPNSGRALAITDHSKRSETQNKKADNDYVCITSGCKYKRKHFLSDCRAFKKMAADEKAQLVLAKKLCKLCFAVDHNSDNCPRKTTWKPCDIQNCGKWHSRLLHGATANGIALTTTAASSVTQEEVLLLVQSIPTQYNVECQTLWDTGSSVSLVTTEFAEKAGLHGVDCSLDLGGVKDSRTDFETKLYGLDIIDRRGSSHKIFAFGIDKITARIPSVNVNAINRLFPNVSDCQVNRDECEVDLLIGMQESELQPVRVQTRGKLTLYSSLFGTGLILAGTFDAHIPGKVTADTRTLLLRSTRCVKTVDFLSAESLGVEIPKRCKLCVSCQECNFKSHQLTWKENCELSAIEQGLKLDTVKKVWIAEYPLLQDPVVLKNNYVQVFSCLKSLEKRLRKVEQLEAFQDQFKDAVARGVFRKLSKEELQAYAGPINYISIVEAYKPGPHVTTPVRLCMNSSLRYGGLSLNDLLMKGPSSLNDIFKVMLGFRRYQVGLVLDISKFYQSVVSCERDQHLRRVLWRDGEGDWDPDVYVTTRVNFGDRPAGCVAQTALRETAKLYSDISPEASRKLVFDSYCDDVVTGGDSHENVRKLSQDMGIIVDLGGFSFKEKIVSGQDLQGDDERKVLGMCWLVKEDFLSIDVHVNFSAKKRGIRADEDMSAEFLRNCAPVLTKRLIWRVVLSQFDLLGLVSVFTVRLKLIMRSLSSEEGQKIAWDDPVPDSIRAEFLSLVELLYSVKHLKFPRSVLPPFWDHSQRPILVAFGDGSQSAYCSLVYVCWPNSDGGHFCRLVAGKTRVAPLKKISVPRLELLGALLSVRLAASVEESLGFDCAGKYYLTDSAAVLGMIKNESSSMKEFVGTRTGEIKSKTDVTSEWFWIPTDQNLADMGTRTETKPEDLGPNSHYQNGLPWMKSALDCWPIKKTLGKIPEEEVVISVRSMVMVENKPVLDPKRFSSFKKFVRVTMRVLAWRWSLVTGKKPFYFMTQENFVCVQDGIFHQFQQEEKLLSRWKHFESLRPRTVGLSGWFGTTVPVLVIAGRVQGSLLVGYDKEGLPLLTASSSISKLIMVDAHNVDHAGLDRTVQRSRELVWIVQARRVAKCVLRNCFECKRRYKVLEKQVMAPLPQHRLPPAPVFGSTAVDLFGPLRIRDSVKKRVSKDCWGVIFVCTVTSAIHLELSEDYSCDSFLLCLKRFVNFRGMPSRFQSDPGTQLMAAASVVKSWDFSQVLDWAAEKQVQWKIVPTNSQHYNGSAEAMIKITKKHLAAITKNLHLTFGEMTTFFSEVMQIVNSRPLTRTAGADIFSGGGPITPLHLMGGRASINVPLVSLDGKASITKRLRFLEETRSEFWKKWLAQVFPHLVPSYRWRRQYRDVQVDDVVLVQDSSLFSGAYKLAIVKEVKKGGDGRVRTVVLKYKNVGNVKEVKDCKFMETERSVHKIAVIVPADWSQDEMENAVQEDLSLKSMEQPAEKTCPVGGSV